MRIFTRYIIREYMKALLWLISSLTFLSLVFDFFEHWDDLLEKGATTGLMALFFLYRMPQYLLYILPMGVLLATFIVLGIMGRNNELIALKGCGISPYRISIPILGMGLLMSAFSFLWAEGIVPLSMREGNRLVMERLGGKRRSGLFKENGLWLKTWSKEGLILYNIKFISTSSTPSLPPSIRGKGGKEEVVLHGITVYRLDRDFQMIQRIDARRAIWINERGWLFQNGTISTLTDDGTYHSETFQERPVELIEGPEDFHEMQPAPEELEFFRLLDYIKRLKKEGYKVGYLLTDLYFKVASAFFSLVIVLFSIPFSMMVEVRSGKVALGIVISLVIGFLYYLLTALGLALGHSGIVPALPAAWMANLIFGSTGLFLFLHMGKRIPA